MPLLVADHEHGQCGVRALEREQSEIRSLTGSSCFVSRCSCVTQTRSPARKMREQVKSSAGSCLARPGTWCRLSQCSRHTLLTAADGERLKVGQRAFGGLVQCLQLNSSGLQATDTGAVLALPLTQVRDIASWAPAGFGREPFRSLCGVLVSAVTGRLSLSKKVLAKLFQTLSRLQDETFASPRHRYTVK
ncbi:hypothetical protein K437DRAFT_59815 [Tilletiaria anomala UBC 951]|uniref:Uncharacterized protein n=1 Tax=Tilletiaria anomala (strain ATCC 24038 / CBS 436.72 / UBC 951) TaxID=1037660 RepID=A0A066WIG7_TILAU|nr:uncharacterized protein K437DRAFT_59815 [Tilletiaria anomala UBC 951]KDN50814.1 hypothetical protein K437DRAFT_59815 [Tilletiaria anomala UBC 951]